MTLKENVLNGQMFIFEVNQYNQDIFTKLCMSNDIEK